MLSKIGMSGVLAIALFVAPAQPSTASCILINAPSEKPCDMGCCANKSCCETSQKNTAPATQPLAKSGVDQQINLISPSSVVIATLHQDLIEFPAFSSAEWTAHSPPPLALICIRLI